MLKGNNQSPLKGKEFKGEQSGVNLDLAPTGQMLFCIVESPLDGHPEGRSKGLEYARACCFNLYNNDIVPFASHLFFTQFLDDTIEDERRAGIAAGLRIAQMANHIMYFTDFGISGGMQQSLLYAARNNIHFSFQKLPEELMARYSNGDFADFVGFDAPRKQQQGSVVKDLREQAKKKPTTRRMK